MLVVHFFSLALPAALSKEVGGLGFGSGYTHQNGIGRLLGSSFGFPGTNVTIDYVVRVVGGGTAGLTVAKRLAENSSLSIAVIEAGGFYELDSGNFSEIPANENLYANAPPTTDWEIFTTPRTVCEMAPDDKQFVGLTVLVATEWAIHSLQSREMPWRIVSTQRR
ncbi:hypothetical protein EV356DRAFT_352071 [Viridothelium virens]|uniref:Uncharacterized protein n=1 Tax=Viridothelium virens TaxID=1048519 RepID=A0A6A6GXR2_VIRVR|nr:hypothetical protein EV356DRAFT_352071 [Viridothelium virens]